MGIRAILQKGRTKPGLTLPADAQAKVNEANDRSTLEKWLGDDAPSKPNVYVVPASPSKAALTSSPTTPPETSESLNEEVAARKAAEEKAAAEAAGVETGDETGGATDGAPTPDDMQLLEGVGAAYEQKLYEAGYTTYEQLMVADHAELAEKVDGLSESSAKGVIKQAKKYNKLKAKGKL
jgi:predicted flap endonuclease-1-like 5' DNA nuclease